MAAQYDLKKSVSPKGKEENITLYPKLVPHGTKTLKDITKDVSMYTGMNASTVQGVLTFLEEALAKYLADGYNVRLGDIGTFSATLISRKVETKEEIRAQSIHFDNVNFRAAKELKRAIKEQMRLERVSPHRAFKTSSDQYTENERFELLIEHLTQKGFITRSGYSELTGLLKTKASIELKKWYLEGKIAKEGKAPHIVYKLKVLQTGTSL